MGPPVDLVCRDLVELVTGYIEGTLSDRRYNAVRTHLADCESCTVYVEQMRTTVGLLARLRDDDLPTELRDRLRDAYRDV